MCRRCLVTQVLISTFVIDFVCKLRLPSVLMITWVVHSIINRCNALVSYWLETQNYFCLICGQVRSRIHAMSQP